MGFPVIVLEHIRPPMSVGFVDDGLTVTIPSGEDHPPVQVGCSAGNLTVTIPSGLTVSFPAPVPFDIGASLNGRPFELPDLAESGLVVSFPAGGKITLARPVLGTVGKPHRKL